jgi:hypothetical protein
MADTMLKNFTSVNEMLNESRAMDAMKICGLNGGWRETDKIHTKF